MAELDEILTMAQNFMRQSSVASENAAQRNQDHALEMEEVRAWDAFAMSWVNHCLIHDVVIAADEAEKFANRLVAARRKAFSAEIDGADVSKESLLCKHCGGPLRLGPNEVHHPDCPTVQR